MHLSWNGLGHHSDIHNRLVSYLWRTILYFTPFVWSVDQITNLELSYLSATVITNIFCTTAIIWRIAGVSGWRNSFKTYRGLMEILIESSVLYTTIYMVRIGLNIHTQYFTEQLDERVQFAQALGFSITVCMLTCFVIGIVVDVSV